MLLIKMKFEDYKVNIDHNKENRVLAKEFSFKIYVLLYKEDP